MTRVIGIIGFPLRHSISPVFQQAALDFLGLDIRYEAWETEPGEVGHVVSRLRSPEYLGMNVTVPFKEVVMPLLDEIDDLAQHIGAVNTVVNREGLLTGYNTDASGFVRALREEAEFDPRGVKAAILGAGGAARAVAFAMAEAGAQLIYILNRSVDRAEALATDLRQRTRLRDATVALHLDQSETTRAILRECNLIVNTTSIGMKHGPAEGSTPITAELIPPRALVYDLVYNPTETPLLAEAKRAGARVLGGLPMLVYQGAAAFELWTGREAPVALMMARAEAALK